MAQKNGSESLAEKTKVVNLWILLSKDPINSLHLRRNGQFCLSRLTLVELLICLSSLCWKPILRLLIGQRETLFSKKSFFFSIARSNFSISCWIQTSVFKVDWFTWQSQWNFVALSEIDGFSITPTTWEEQFLSILQLLLVFKHQHQSFIKVLYQFLTTIRLNFVK